MLFGVRRRLASRTAKGAARTFLSAAAPDPGQRIDEVPLLALDLELTGLDARRAEIVSIGFVPIDGLRIKLDGAHKLLVRPEGNVENSAHVHMIRDADLVDAGRITDAMAATLEALAGRALLVHYAGLDHGVLNRVCRQLWQVPLLVPIVDTLAIAHRSVVRTGREPEQGSLRLPALRARYGLPVAHLHGALSDAVATAELFLAMVAERGRQTRLRDYL